MNNKILITTVLLMTSSVFAFKQGVHENITDKVLATFGFEANSIDEVSDSNFYTDIFEPGTEAAHADNNTLDEASLRLVSKKLDILNSLESCDKRSALDALGEALHTVQDIVSHSNTVENGHVITQESLFSLSRGTAFCDSEQNFAPGGLVSGYFSLSGFLEGGILGSIPISSGFAGNQCSGMPTGDCCHLDLNKDDASQLNKVNHAAAKTEAERLTSAFIVSLFADIDDKFGENADYYKNLLKNRQSRAIFVVDDTGSMSTDIAGVQSAVHGYIDDGISKGLSQQLGLITFKDSPVDHGMTCDVEAFKESIDRIRASGGGDCPEASGAALNVALAKFRWRRGDLFSPGGTVTLFSDADPRSPASVASARSLATALGVQITTVITGSCGSTSASKTAAHPSASDKNTSIDIALTKNSLERTSSASSAYDLYRDLAIATGGISFRVNRSEVADILPVYLNISDVNSAPLLNEVITLDEATNIEKNIKVDSTMQGSKLTFVLSIDEGSDFPDYRLVAPSGDEIVEGDKVEFIAVSGVQSIIVNDAVQGDYKLTLTGGTGTVVARAYGETSLLISDVKMFRKPELAVRHIDWVPINGRPSQGEAVLLKLSLSAQSDNVSISILSDEGELIMTPALSLVGDTGRKYQFEFNVPDQPFRLVVNGGSTADVVDFTRELPYSIRPVPLTVNVFPEWDSVAPSESRTFQLEVTNNSDTEEAYKVYPELTISGSFEDIPEFTLPAGDTVLLDVVLTVNNDATLDELTELIFEIRSVNDSTLYNTALSRVLIEQNDAPLAQDDFYNVNVGENISLGVKHNDTDPNGDVLTISEIDSVSKKGGQVTLVDGFYVFTPLEGVLGDDEVSYTITDSRGAYSSATAYIFINRPPTATSDQFIFVKAENSTRLVNLTADDIDEDGHIISISSIENIEGSGITLTILELGEVEISVLDSAVEDITVTYEINDGFGGQDQGSVTVLLNSRPIANDDSATTVEQEPVTINVLVNDTDLDGDTLTAELSTNQSKFGGAISLSNGIVTYVAADDYQGSDSFTYTASDVHGDSSEASVNITVDAKKKSSGTFGLFGIFFIISMVLSRRSTK